MLNDGLVIENSLQTVRETVERRLPVLLNLFARMA